MTRFLGILFLSVTRVLIVVGSYEVPPALVEPLKPQGLRVSIPDEKGITLFAFHGNVNEDFENGKEAGQMATDVVRKKNGRWTYVNRNIRLKLGDTLYYWLYVIKDNLGYERLFQSHLVKELIGDTTLAPSDVTPAPPRPPVSPAAPSPPSPSPESPSVPQCNWSPTQVNGNQNWCKGKLIFNSEFRNGLHRNWSHVVQFEEDEGEFTVFDNDVDMTFLQSGKLVIKPIFLDNKYYEGYTTDETLDLRSRCTSTSVSSTACIQTSEGRIILPPVISGRVTTEHKFSFRYGTVEIKAKLPHGDWVVPEIWLIPKGYKYGRVKSGRIVLAKSFGNDDLKIGGIDDGSNFLHSGLDVGKETNSFGYKKTTGSLSDDYHLFKVVWGPDKIQFFIDGQDYGSWNSKNDPAFLVGHADKIAPFNEEFHLVLGIHVGGIVDFPDNSLNRGKPKPWRQDETARRLSFYRDSVNWLRTWDDRTALRVEHVKVWAL